MQRGLGIASVAGLVAGARDDVIGARSNDDE